MSRNRRIPYTNGLRAVLPDMYECPGCFCNTCHFNIMKFDSYYEIESDGCTEVGCFDCDADSKKYELCFNNWLLSGSIYYQDYSDFLNNCINGYRNITYIKQQQALDKSFVAAMNKTYEHTFVSLHNGINLSLKLYKFLKRSGFDEKKLLSFSVYLRYRNFPHLLSTYKISGEKQGIAAQKEIFDFIASHPNPVKEIVTDEIIEQFQKQYIQYKENLERYSNETFEELARLGY